MAFFSGFQKSGPLRDEKDNKLKTKVTLWVAMKEKQRKSVWGWRSLQDIMGGHEQKPPAHLINMNATTFPKAHHACGAQNQHDAPDPHKYRTHAWDALGI